MSIDSGSQTDNYVKPRIAITVGDVTGVGPELAMRCASLPEVTARCDPILVGPAGVLRRIADCLGMPMPENVLDVGALDPGLVKAGQFDGESGLASFQAVRHAIDLAMSGQISGFVTGPIQKEAWQLAGIEYPGHTELLAALTETSEYTMMLTSEAISCVLATIHIPLADVASALSTDLVSRAIRLGAAALTQKQGRPARVTVCGLNPHAGENGMLSHGEERDIIVPAVQAARNLGIQVRGPLPPDTAFTPAWRRETDVYVCMYHDQGLIPLKALAFDDAVNVTLGLPIVRTSVDHGTALDLAWQGKANHQSMLAAIDMAIDLC